MAAKLSGDVLSILNDDCIYQILEWLPLDDLCWCSRTCKRLQILCGNQFRRKYKNEVNGEFWIRIERDGVLSVDPAKSYVKYFYNFIKKLDICVWETNESKVSLVVNFIKSKCDQNLYKICINGDLKLTSLHKEIGSFLHNTQIVEFVDRTETCQDEAIFLRYCPNLTKLNLSYRIPVENVVAVLERKYHQLTHFKYMLGRMDNLKVKKLKKFFQMHDKIQSVAWRFNIYDDGYPVKYSAVKCLKTLDYALNIEHLFLSIGLPLTKCYDVVFNYLKKLCKRDNFKCLEIELEYDEGAVALNLHAKQLADLKQLTKISFAYMKFSDVLPALRSLVHLKSILFQCMWGEENRDRLDEVDSSWNILPQVEEVQIEYIDSSESLSYCVMHIVKHWMNVKRILVPRSSKCIVTFDELNQMNCARENLKNASELTIYTDHEGNATNLNHKLVKLKVVDFEYDCASLSQRCYITKGHYSI